MKTTSKSITSDEEKFLADLVRLGGAVTSTFAMIQEDDSHSQAEILQLKKELDSKKNLDYTIKEKAFLEAFNEFMRAKYAVCLALLNGEVSRKKDSFDTAAETLKDISPFITNNFNLSASAAIGLTVMNLLSSYITEFKNDELIRASNNIKEFFSGSMNEFIDSKLIQEIGIAIIFRYKDQINQLTVGYDGQGEYRLGAKDGVVVFAKRVSHIIIFHIMRNEDKTIEKNSIKQATSPVVRCINALYKCKKDSLEKDEYLPRIAELEKKDGNKWLVVGLIQNTGIKFLNNFYILKAPLDFIRDNQLGSAHHVYGFCNSDVVEINDRGFEMLEGFSVENVPIQKTINSELYPPKNTASSKPIMNSSLTDPLLGEKQDGKNCCRCNLS